MNINVNKIYVKNSIKININGNIKCNIKNLFKVGLCI